MIVHLFNSSSVSGPERLVLPALASAREHFLIINLREERIDRLRESDPLEDYALSLDLEYRDVRVCGHWDYVAVRELRGMLERLNPELVHAHDVKASAYLLQARQGPLHRVPIVSTHHGVHGRPDLKTRFYEWLYRRYLLKSFDRASCVSSADYDFLLRSGLDKNRLRLHLNGIDGHWVEGSDRAKESTDIRARWFPHEDNRDSLFLFGMVGRLSAEKDHSRLLNILSQFHRLPCEQEWRCLVFGTGPLEKSLKEQAHRLGLDGRVCWMGYRKDVGNELAGLDLVLSLSKAEGLPINLIEAGWAGTPVLCTPVGGINDLIPDESYGGWVPSAESPLESARRLQTCLSAPGRIQLQNQAARFQRRVAVEFTQAKWFERLKEIYAELHVGLTASPLKELSWLQPEETTPVRAFSRRLKTLLSTRLLLYPNGRLGEIRKWNRNGFRILMYHRFSSSSRDGLAKQCEHITQYYHPVSLTDIAQHIHEGVPLPPNALAVTVDDGYRDFMINAAPVFRTYQIPVTVFLVGGFLDQQWLWWDRVRYAVENTRRASMEISLFPNHPPARFPLVTSEQRQQTIWALTEALKEIDNADRLDFLNEVPKLLQVDIPVSPPPAMAPMQWSEVRHLMTQGVDFGAHTMTHPILSRVADAAELSEEIALSKQRVEEELNRPVLHFGYPNGRREDVNARTFKVLEQCQFQTAVTAERGVNFQGAYPFWLRRIGVDPMMSKFNFQALLAGLGGSRSKERPFSMAGHS